MPRLIQPPNKLSKKNLPEQVKALQQAYPEASVELWATDQHRIGLKPILRRIWVRRGSRPRVRVQQRYEWLSVYTFVRPTTGQTEWYLLPSVTAELFSIALALFAQAVGAGPTQRVLLVLDQAGWHSSQELVVPEGIHLLSLPPYSPELQPCERLWPLSNEGVANEAFRSLDELEEAQVQRCIVLQNQPEVIHSHTCFHWWPPSDSKHQ
jgi:DDE superfamily endonuclease